MTSQRSRYRCSRRWRPSAMSWQQSGTQQDLSETRRRDWLGRQPGRSAPGRCAGAHCAGHAVDQRQASQAERGGCRRVDEDVSQSAVRFPGRREGERPPFGPPLRPGPLSPEWQALLQELSTQRAHLGLSRFARYASERGIEPSGVDDSTIEAFIATVRAETLHRKPNDLHRKVAQIWNEAAESSSLALQSVQIPSFKRRRNARTGRRSAIPSRPMPSAISRGVPGRTCSQPMPGGAPWRRERFSCVVTRSMRP